MTEKGTWVNSCISLRVDDSIILDPQTVCNVFNSHFSEAAANIGRETPPKDNDDIDPIVSSYDGHQSITDIQVKSRQGNSFDFPEVLVHEINRLI